MSELSEYLQRKQQQVEAALAAALPPADARPAVLHQAMRYSVLAGGKRLRPLLCLATAEALGAEGATALRPALALELLHTYTLVHDDLPAMDDDALRRGQPTAHVAFGEANAILAGDALLTLAFEWLAGCLAPAPYPPNQYALELAQAGGHAGVIAGQVEDLAAEHESHPTAEQLDYIHLHKTATLIRAAVRMGAIAGGATPAQLEALGRYGAALGLAFQIVDDILNATATAEQLGKAVGSDAARGKLTYVALHGLDAARDKARALIADACAELERAHIPGPILPALARYVVERTH